MTHKAPTTTTTVLPGLRILGIPLPKTVPLRLTHHALTLPSPYIPFIQPPVYLSLTTQEFIHFASIYPSVQPLIHPEKRRNVGMKCQRHHFLSLGLQGRVVSPPFPSGIVGHGLSVKVWVH